MQGLLDAMGEAAGDRYVNYNYGAALFGQASVEMIQFMELLGGKPTTPIGLLTFLQSLFYIFLSSC